jgi:hypothetical protein
MYGVERTIDGHVVPSEFAPTPITKYLSTKYPRVCSVCWQMYMTIEHLPYWQNLNTERANNTARRKAGEADDGYVST